ncbi:WD40 repeat-like protein [Aureobasidium subglaciale]|nr:WD40 repeat-like protein [Aureobasidium subglaciale]
MPQTDASSWRQRLTPSKNKHPKKPRTQHRRFFESKQDVRIGPFSVTLKARYPVRSFFKNLSLRLSLHHKSSDEKKPNSFRIPSRPVKHSSKRRASSTSHRTIHSESIPKYRSWLDVRASKKPLSRYQWVCPVSPIPIKPAAVPNVCRLIDSINLDGCDDAMDIDENESRADTDVDMDIDTDDEPEPMEGVEYSENIASRASINFLSRRPSALRNQNCSRPRPSRTPDRFVLDRGPDVQPRERFMLSSPPHELTAYERWDRRQSHVQDYFGWRTKIRRGPELTKPPATSRPFRTPGLFMSSRVNPFGPVTLEGPREFSQGAVWNVGGSSPASPDDGVRSTSDGRGGQITSGTNAPMFRSDFLKSVHDESDHIQIHGKRLSAAMDLDQASRVLNHGHGLPTPVSSPDSDAGGAFSPILWRDTEWTKPGSPSLLDAPALRDDYYCSLLAYSDTAQCLAVGLGAQVYTWSETRGVDSPESLGPPASGHVTSLSFSSTEGGRSILAVGRSNGCLTLWSSSELVPRFNHTHRSSISCVCFSPRTFRRASIYHAGAKVQVEYLLVGDEAGHVFLYSVEWPDKIDVDIFAWPGRMIVLARFDLHTQQICGLAWSPNGQFFASGGNDNALFVFETRRILQPDDTVAQPLIMVANDFVYYWPSSQEEAFRILPGRENYRYMLNAAVKALAFCPWQPSLLAAGGGSNDRCIHFYHTTSGAKLATIDCSSQVTSLVWSKTRREIAATFGFTQPDHPIRVAVFSWPACECIVRVP